MACCFPSYRPRPDPGWAANQARFDLALDKKKKILIIRGHDGSIIYDSHYRRAIFDPGDPAPAGQGLRLGRGLWRREFNGFRRRQRPTELPGQGHRGPGSGFCTPQPGLKLARQPDPQAGLGARGNDPAAPIPSFAFGPERSSALGPGSFRARFALARWSRARLENARTPVSFT